MIKKLSRLIFMIMVFLTTGCIKETYDMNMLSKKAHLSPTFAISAVRGNIAFSDIVDPSDTVVFEEGKPVTIVFKKDSILDFVMTDFYDLNDMVAFNQTYPIGVLSVDPFGGTVTYTLDQIRTKLGEPYLTTFGNLDGTTANFPPFPSVNMVEIPLPDFPNFDNALFYSGAIDISVINNLPTPLNGVNIKLYDYAGNTQIGDEATISYILPGQTLTTPIDLGGLSLTNSMSVAVVITGCPGTSNPVLIDLDASNVQITIQGRDLKVLSGRIILPIQTIMTLDNRDTVTFYPGPDVEIDEFEISTGDLSYTIQSAIPATASLTITLPTSSRDGDPVSEEIIVNPNTNETGTISVDNTFVDLGTDVAQPYNRVPLEYTVVISSNNTKIDFSWTDEFQIDMELLNPDFDYVKGYFGQQTEAIQSDTFKLEIEKIMDHIAGDFLISSPSIKLIYSNSFAIPIEINLNAAGYKKAETVDLGKSPFPLAYPVAPGNRDMLDTFAIDKTNSNLPALISMPPEEIRFDGSAVMNPLGNDGSRNNYIFSDSRFIGLLEVEVPLEFRTNNLQFTDTADNFLKTKSSDEDNPIKPENFEFMRVDITAKNGFPLGVSIKMSLYNSSDSTIKSTVDASEILEPAPVDIDGKASGFTETSTSIEFTKEFFSSVDEADKIIFQFTMVTTGNGSKDVKIYSDYRIDFNAALVLKPDINLK